MPREASWICCTSSARTIRHRTSRERAMASKMFLAACAMALCVAAGSSQTPAQLPQFEVATIKPNKSGDGRVMMQIQPGGRFSATNVTLRQLIRNAYQLQDFQIVGGPGWQTDDHFDVVAKAESGDGLGDPFRAERQGEPS